MAGALLQVVVLGALDDVLVDADVRDLDATDDAAGEGRNGGLVISFVVVAWLLWAGACASATWNWLARLFWRLLDKPVPRADTRRTAA